MDYGVPRIPVDEIEKRLAEVAEVKAARVVVADDGLIEEVHVLALPSKAPKQLVRDIESTIMASFGIPIDHKKISIAQLGREAVRDMGSGQRLSAFRPRIVAINAAVNGVNASAAVTLEIDGDEYVGEASGPASQTGRQRLVALATLDSLVHYATTVSLALEDVAIVQLGRERVAVAAVTVVSPYGEQSFAGSALVRQNEKDSIVRATLDAINRRMSVLTTG